MVTQPCHRFITCLLACAYRVEFKLKNNPLLDVTVGFLVCMDKLVCIDSDWGVIGNLLGRKYRECSVISSYCDK